MVWRSKQNPKVLVKVNFRLISGNASGPTTGSGYSGMTLVDQVVTNKGVRVVAAQTMPAGQAPVAPPATSPMSVVQGTATP